MSSSWRSEVLAVLRKEIFSEVRTKSGLVTSGLFGVASVVTIALATFNTKLNGDIAAGLLWVTILFASILSLPRTFLVEEEQGTADMLRLVARPHSVFWGKALFNLLLTGTTSAGLAVLFLIFTGQPIALTWLLVLSLIGGCGALTGAVTLCGALVAQAANRAALAGAIAIPLLLPVLAMGVSGTRVALSQGILDANTVFAQDFLRGGIAASLGLWAYAVASLAIGPWLFAAVWKS